MCSSWHDPPWQLMHVFPFQSAGQTELPAPGSDSLTAGLMLHVPWPRVQLRIRLGAPLNPYDRNTFYGANPIELGEFTVIIILSLPALSHLTIAPLLPLATAPCVQRQRSPSTGLVNV